MPLQSKPIWTQQCALWRFGYGPISVFHRYLRSTVLFYQFSVLDRGWRKLQSLGIGIQRGMERIVDIIQGLLLLINRLIDAVRDRDEITRLVVLKGSPRSNIPVNCSLKVIDKHRFWRIWRLCLECPPVNKARVQTVITGTALVVFNVHSTQESDFEIVIEWQLSIRSQRRYIVWQGI